MIEKVGYQCKERHESMEQNGVQKFIHIYVLDWFLTKVSWQFREGEKQVLKKWFGSTELPTMRLLGQSRGEESL